MTVRVKVAAGPLGMRELEELVQGPHSFAIFGAYDTRDYEGPPTSDHKRETAPIRVPKKDNQAAHGRLMAELQKMGYKHWQVRPLMGHWGGKSEQSYIVLGMSFEDVIDIGRRYEQDTVIWKGPDGVLAMYSTKPGGEQTATPAVDADNAFKGPAKLKQKQKSKKPKRRGPPAPDEYISKSRSTSFEFEFDWDKSLPYKGPLMRGDVEHLPPKAKPEEPASESPQPPKEASLRVRAKDTFGKPESRARARKHFNDGPAAEAFRFKGPNNSLGQPLNNRPHKTDPLRKKKETKEKKEKKGGLTLIASDRLVLSRVGYGVYEGSMGGRRIVVRREEHVAKGSYPANRRQKRETRWAVSVDGEPVGEGNSLQEARGIACQALIQKRALRREGLETPQEEIVEQNIEQLSQGNPTLRQQYEQATRSLSEDSQVPSSREMYERRQLHKMRRNLDDVRGARLVDENEHEWVYAIDTYEASKRLGSKNWCISRDEETWDDYRANGISFFFHISKQKGPPATYCVAMLERDGRVGTETYNAQDEVMLSLPRDDFFSYYEKEHGSEDLGITFAARIQAVLSANDEGERSQAVQKLLEVPNAIAGVAALAKAKRLPAKDIIALTFAISSARPAYGFEVYSRFIQDADLVREYGLHKIVTEYLQKSEPNLGPRALAERAQEMAEEWASEGFMPQSLFVADWLDAGITNPLKARHWQDKDVISPYQAKRLREILGPRVNLVHLTDKQLRDLSRDHGLTDDDEDEQQRARSASVRVRRQAGTISVVNSEGQESTTYLEKVIIGDRVRFKGWTRLETDDGVVEVTPGEVATVQAVNVGGPTLTVAVNGKVKTNRGKDSSVGLHSVDVPVECVSLVLSSDDSRAKHGSQATGLDIRSRRRKSAGVKLVHFSRVPGLSTIDPLRMGDGSLSNREREDMRVPVSYFYRAGTEAESLVYSAARARYEVELPDSAKLLDLAQAPQEVYQAFREDGRGAMLQVVKDMGFDGFYSSSSQLPGAVCLFYPVPAVETEMSHST